MRFFLSLNTKDNILKNVNQGVVGSHYIFPHTVVVNDYQQLFGY